MRLVCAQRADCITPQCNPVADPIREPVAIKWHNARRKIRLQTVEFASGKNTVRIRMYDPMQDTERRSQKFQRPYLKEFVKRIKEQYGEEFHTELPDENIDTKPSKVCRLAYL